VKYERSASFKADYLKLSVPNHEQFKRAVREMNQAAGDLQDPRRIHWPAKVRIKPVQAAPGVFEMTWNFSGPDGRATFEFVQVDGNLAVRWRRIRDHRMLGSP
jgi:hypothetical protein